MEIGDKQGVLSPIWWFQNQNAVFKSFVVSDADIVAGDAEGCPGDMEPAVAGQELVGVFTSAEEVDQALELARVLGSDVGSLPQQVLGVLDATNQSIDARVAEAGVDDDGTDHLAGWLQ